MGCCIELAGNITIRVMLHLSLIGPFYAICMLFFINIKKVYNFHMQGKTVRYIRFDVGR